MSPQAQALLRSQKQRYLTRLPEKGRELMSLWRRVGEGHLSEFLDAIHRLAGSAGLHGLDRIQQLAAAVETRLKAHLEEPLEYDSEVRELIRLVTAQGSE